MASTYKPINNEDVTNTRTLLHEAIPITGTIISGTYNEAATLGFGNETLNAKETDKDSGTMLDESQLLDD